MADAPPPEQLSEAEHLTLLDDILQALFGNRTRESRPVACFVGGQPGSGKTSTILDLQRELSIPGQAELPLIQGDDLRLYHPRYEEFLAHDDRTMSASTRRDANRWTNEVIAHGAEHGISFIAELSMRDPERTRDVLAGVREQGMQVHVYLLAVHPCRSRARTLGRYYTERAEGQASRYVEAQIHEQGCEELEQSLRLIQEQRLADRLILVDHAGRILLEDGVANPASALDTFRRAVAHVSDADELRLYIMDVLKLVDRVGDTELTAGDRRALEDMLSRL